MGVPNVAEAAIQDGTLTQLPVHIEDTMNFETYTDFLQVPRLLNVQLRAPGATGEQLQQHPARLSREGREISDARA